MNKETKNLIISKIQAGKSVEDVVTLLTMTDVFATKAEARVEVVQVCEDEGLDTKKTSKSGDLKDWFLAQPEPTAVTAEQIKEQCALLEMKGGSIQYYINSYKLAIDLFQKIQGK